MSSIPNDIVVEKNIWGNFDEGMQFSSGYKQKEQIKKWDTLKSRYNQIKDINLVEQKIPKIIHQIWLGGKMPEFEAELCDQIKKNKGEDWQYILWTEESIKNLKNFKNIDFYNISQNVGQKSDLLRYAILYEYGGVYLDTDFLLIKNFDQFLGLDFFCGISYDSEPNVFNGLIGSSIGNKIIESLLTLDKPLTYADPMSLMDSTGPFFLTRKVFENIDDNPLVVALPNSFFYPFPNFNRDQLLGPQYTNYIKSETICCHMWSSRWM
jgi:mannosyltransferase OCH1-like enzyme